MDAAVLRRYLQPSPTLRWHPWAPLFAALLLVTFIFVFGVRWGYSAGMRFAGEREAYSATGMETIRHHLEAARPGWMMVASARQFDAIAVDWLRDQEERKSIVRRMQLAAEELAFDRGRAGGAFRRTHARHVVEYRLNALSGAAPLWQRTATVCREVGKGLDLRDELARAAKAYTALMGREITPEQLAPLSGAVCS
jgi:hypothetical protein